MGNCVWRGFTGDCQAIKVVTASGGIMELYGPITAECITNEFPGHALFRRHILCQPLLHSEELIGGELYYLLPLDRQNGGASRAENPADGDVPSENVSGAPYRMSFDSHGLDMLPRVSSHVLSRWRRPGMEVFPVSQTTGIWKVRLVISPEQLSEILSEESHTEALIESVRTVAKCGSGFPSAANSDQWSLSSSWKQASAENLV
ncbi:hypothetical protein AMTRI_Chr09g38590 [Amborella trichopoda]|uniref:Uncharacterized protein n=1 Tax=Amborella trichopoda TaxID=13333 RepID=W1NV19_AMBTC|nr:uncharacterized protein LOC18426529 [Amborella trichopoda]ERM98514.1 hypothetical protein AMTR_s00113p00026730 [Amborella trichopoda]|eukprot:XP_006833236.1 uncharacterized protein LOC18426529 [Amborella trichopoda]